MAEAEVMRSQALALGVPDTALVLERESRTTRENASFTRRICDERGIRSILLVTSAYHSRRARRIFQDVFAPAIAVSTQPAPQGDCPLCWPLVPDRASVVLYEYGNWIEYWTGRIAPP